MPHRRTSSASSQNSASGVILTPATSAPSSRRNSLAGSESSSALVLTPQSSRMSSFSSQSTGQAADKPSIPRHLRKITLQKGGPRRPSKAQRPGRPDWTRLPLPEVVGPHPALRSQLRCPFVHNEQLLRSVLPEGKGEGKALTQAEKHILYRLRQAAKAFKAQKKRIPIILFTDIGMSLPSIARSSV